MGTSSRYGGAKGSSPLVPSWLDGDAPSGGSGAADPAAPPPPPADPNAPPSDPVGPAAVAVPLAMGAADRFTSARSNFSRFASSGGRDRRSLGRAVSQYVGKSAGGAASATRRMGASRTSAARLVGFLNTAQQSGVQQALRTLSLERLAGRPVEEVFAGLADYICPEGGSIDEGVARDAFIETVADLANAGITDIDGLTPAQVQTVFELYATHSIEARICNDVGTRLVTLPSDVQSAERVQAQLREFIHRSVSDALARTQTNIQALTPERVLEFVNATYKSAFEVLQSLGEAEAAK